MQHAQQHRVVSPHTSGVCALVFSMFRKDLLHVFEQHLRFSRYPRSGRALYIARAARPAPLRPARQFDEVILQSQLPARFEETAVGSRCRNVCAHVLAAATTVRRVHRVALADRVQVVPRERLGCQLFFWGFGGLHEGCRPGAARGPERGVVWIDAWKFALRARVWATVSATGCEFREEVYFEGPGPARDPQHRLSPYASDTAPPPDPVVAPPPGVGGASLPVAKM